MKVYVLLRTRTKHPRGLLLGVYSSYSLAVENRERIKREDSEFAADAVYSIEPRHIDADT